MIRCIGYDASSQLLPNASATEVEHVCVASSTLVTPTAKSALPGTPPKPSEASTTSTAQLWLSDTPTGLADNLQDQSCPPEINKLGRTIARWTPQIANWHISKVTNRCHRSPQQPDQTRQTGSVRVPQLRELPNPRSPLRRETQLGPTRHDHSPLKRGEPVIVALLLVQANQNGQSYDCPSIAALLGVFGETLMAAGRELLPIERAIRSGWEPSEQACQWYHCRTLRPGARSAQRSKAHSGITRHLGS